LVRDRAPTHPLRSRARERGRTAWAPDLVIRSWSGCGRSGHWSGSGLGGCRCGGKLILKLPGRRRDLARALCHQEQQPLRRMLSLAPLGSTAPASAGHAGRAGGQRCHDAMMVH